MKEWMAQADRPKGSSTIERMNGRPQPLFSNRVTHYFKEWTTPSGLEKIYCSHKIFDASNRSLNSSCSLKR